MFSPIPSIKGVKSDGQHLTCVSREFFLFFLPLLPSFVFKTLVLLEDHATHISLNLCFHPFRSLTPMATSLQLTLALVAISLLASLCLSSATTIEGLEQSFTPSAPSTCIVFLGT